MTDSCNPQSGPDTLESLRRAMAQLQEHNERLAAAEAAADARMTALEREVEDMNSTMEEMRAAERFSGNEWREHCTRLETRCARAEAESNRLEKEHQRLVDMIGSVVATAVGLLPAAEQTVRRHLQEAEAAARRDVARAVYRDTVTAAAAAARGEAAVLQRGAVETQLHWLCRAMDCTLEELRSRFLSRCAATGGGPCGRQDTRGPSRGLWELYAALQEVGFPTSDAVAELLRGEKLLKHLSFGVPGHEEEEEAGVSFLYHPVPPTAAVYDFFTRVLGNLPNLRELSFSNLPPLAASPESRAWVTRAPPTLTTLEMEHTDYTVADLLALCQRCPSLRFVGVHTARCTDWGEYAADRVEESKTQVDRVTRDIIYWRD